MITKKLPNPASKRVEPNHTRWLLAFMALLEVGLDFQS